MATAMFPAPDGSSDSAFGNLIDLARLHAGGANAVSFCESCNTINKASAHLCKCCAYRLPAFYAWAVFDDAPVPAKAPRALATGGWAMARVAATALRRFADHRHDLHRFLAAHFAPTLQALE
jgi:hypothetical protein